MDPNVIGFFGWIAFLVSLALASARVMFGKLDWGFLGAGAALSLVALVLNLLKLTFVEHNTGAVVTSAIVMFTLTVSFVIAFAQEFASNSVSEAMASEKAGKSQGSPTEAL